MQTRPGVFSQPGGDTVLASQLQEHLRRAGVHVDIDADGTKRPEDYDLVHLFNFATPEHTESLARRVAGAGVPYVVTALYEDQPRFYNQMMALYMGLRHYVSHGQIRAQWLSLMDAVKTCAPSQRTENTWTAEHAAALLATGYAEKKAILRDYPKAAPIHTFQCGSDVASVSFDPKLFTQQYGLSDFVLCVGRLETRKNQLMLLKALEDSDLTVVFATSGFTYQPEYEQLCRAFKRKGKTIFLPRLEPAMLASAYAAARVHALPSWYELPGLVSIEAARAGAAVMTSDFGTIRDYLGSDAYYAAPDDAEGIRRAVTAAFEEYPTRIAIRESIQIRLSHLTWENAARQTVQVYQAVLAGAATQPSITEVANPAVALPTHRAVANVAAHAAQAQQSIAAIGQAFAGRQPTASEKTESICAQGEELLKQGDIDGAIVQYQNALAAEPHAIKPRKGLGVSYLLKTEWAKAAAQFRVILDVEPEDGKALAGYGASLWQLGKHEEAFRFYIQACAADTDDLTAITHLLQASYALSRFEDLERVLRSYVRHHPENLEMQYCLAGCYYQQKKISHAMGLLERILHVDSTHARALELRTTIAEQKNVEPAESQEVAESEAPIESQLKAIERAKELKDFPRTIEGALLIEANPLATPDEKAIALILHGEALACMGHFADAATCFEATRENRVHRYRALTGLGVLHATSAKWADAEKMFIEACTAKADYDVAIAGLGLCAAQFGNHEKAWGYYRRALGCNPENIRALFGLIELAYQLQRFGELERALQEYLRYNPLDLGILYSLAGCYFAQGKIADARATLEKILFVKPDHALSVELMERLDTTGVQAVAG